jgi:hypothetical protein
MTVSENHRIAAEVFGTACWLWVFHRARHDLPVVLGFRHPWEHPPGEYTGDEQVHHVEMKGANSKDEIRAAWDKFDATSTKLKEDDDDDDDE